MEQGERHMSPSLLCQQHPVSLPSWIGQWGRCAG
jgi:hypothetical protein